MATDINLNISSFPQKLYALVENEPKSVVTWSESGTSFRVNDIEKFSSEIVPKYFRRKLPKFTLILMLTNYIDTKMTSFQRQLNLYGFRRITKGEDTGSYHHPNFQQNRPDLVAEIKRVPVVKGNIKKLEDELVASDFKRELAPVDEASMPLKKPHLESNRSQSPNGLKFPMPKYSPRDLMNGIDLKTSQMKYSAKPNDVTNFTSTNLAKHNALITGTTAAGDAQVNKPNKRDRSTSAAAVPFLERNFSISSVFDSEHKLPPTTAQTRQNAMIRNASFGTSLTTKPPPFSRDESDSWVKLDGLDHDMDPFDIEQVFNDEKLPVTASATSTTLPTSTSGSAGPSCTTTTANSTSTVSSNSSTIPPILKKSNSKPKLIRQSASFDDNATVDSSIHSDSGAGPIVF